MNGKTFFKALSIKMRQGLSIGKGLAKSYVSLFLVLILSVTSTLAWFTAHEEALISSGNLEFQSASSLRINKDQSSGNLITIPAFTLDEVSSLDGRNIYLPVGESFNENTAEMFFREGNVGDENTHYVYKNFELKGSSGNTRVFIKSYKITVSDANGDMSNNDGINGVYQDELKVENDINGKPNHQVLPPDNCAIRLAFISDSASSPVVIDPSAQVVNYVDNTIVGDTATGGAVSLIDENGSPTLESSYPNYNWNSFSTYYYEHTPLFVIKKNQTLRGTLVVWLEGTLPNAEEYIGKEITVDVEIESNFAEMDTITFVDDTFPDDNVDNGYNWVSDSDAIIACSYEDPFSTDNPKRWKTIIMRKTKDRTGKYSSDTGAEWQCEIPKRAVTNISFYRLNPNNGSATQGHIWNAWHTRQGVMSMTNNNISDSWFVNGTKVGRSQAPLQEDRRFLDTSTNTWDNSLVYTAVHGNAYSTTDDEWKRLSPCIGYWGWEPGSGSSSTGGGGQQSGGGGEQQSGSCEVTFIFRVPDDKTWVYQYGWLVLTAESGNEYDMKNPAMSDNDKCATKTLTVPVGEKLVGIYKRQTDGGHLQDQHFSSTVNAFTVPSGAFTITYEMNNQKQWSHNARQ